MTLAVDNGTAASTDLNLAEPSLVMTERADGSILLSWDLPPTSYPAQLSEYLRKWAQAAPEHPFLAERDKDGNWRYLTYGAALEAANSVSQALLDQGHTADRPIASLSDNSIDMAILMLATMQVGIPFMPLSPAYALLSDDFGKLKQIFALTNPSLVYVSSPKPFAQALQALSLEETPILASDDDGSGNITLLEDYKSVKPGSSFEKAYRSVGPDSIAKLMFTSGSTGAPKAVITTQCMMCANVAAHCQILPSLERTPPVIVDWLPWNHVAGSNVNFNIILRCGGTLYIDEGRPKPGQFDKTLDNLREIQPSFFSSVPLVYDMLVTALEADEAFCKHFFGKLDFLIYAAAPLPSSLWDRLKHLNIKALGRPVPFLSSLGATETAPSSLFCYWPQEVSGNVGIPLPGVEVKLAPVAGKLELRVKGPNVTPGYYRNEEASQAAFDTQGYYKTGDAVKFIDQARPEQGLMFDGRIAENFKLLSGTWVQVGMLRTDIVSALSPYVRDAVIAGEGQNEIGVLVFLNPEACRTHLKLGDDDDMSELISNKELRAAFQAGLAAHNAKNPGSSRKVARLAMLADPPFLSAGEITEKGYLNQRAILGRRVDEVARLFDPNADDDVIVA